MKKVVLIIAVFLGICATLFAQTPDFFNYQAVVRNDQGELVKNTNVNFSIYIREASPTGTVVFSESQLIKSSSQGLCNIKVGAGSDASGSITDLDWGNNTFYLDIAVDIAGGTAFTSMGAVQLVSVPYSFFYTKCSNCNQCNQCYERKQCRTSRIC